MAKEYKLGFIKMISINGCEFTYKVEILHEFEKNYEVNYLYPVKIRSKHGYREITDKETLVSKEKIFDIHTIKSSWFKRLMFGL